jgi:non-specific serine/threonine protein kinase
MAVCLDALARLAMERGRGRRAALLLGAADRVWGTLGMSHTGNVLTNTRLREPALEPVRNALGERDFEEQFARGARLEIARAIEFALDSGLDDPSATESRAIETSPLTKRELEVADLVAEGLTNPEIAARLVISVRTAQGHVENILRKLGFNARAQIAAWMAERRLGDLQA